MQSSVSVVNAYCPCWGAYMSDIALNALFVVSFNIHNRPGRWALLCSFNRRGN